MIQVEDPSPKVNVLTHTQRVVNKDCTLNNVCDIVPERGNSLLKIKGSCHEYGLMCARIMEGVEVKSIPCLEYH